MPRLYDTSDNRPLGEVSQDEIELLRAQMKQTPGRGDNCVDNETFLGLVKAGASSALLDAVKMALDRGGEAHIGWQVDSDA